MSLKVVLFDLDGTLLPMNQDNFTKFYFSQLAEKMSEHGYEPQQLIDGVLAGTAAMVKNDGSRTNEQAFWDTFCGIFGEKALQDKPVFEDFYANEFKRTRGACGFDYTGAEIVYACWRMGLKVVLATNPIFPEIATNQRIDWAGLFPTDFALVTTYENSCYCKPNPKYYTNLMEKLNVRPEECLMIGNDVDEDMVAADVGMHVFLMTRRLINRHNKDISVYPNGGYDELYDLILKLHKQ